MVYQPFVRRSFDGFFVLLVAKVVNDICLAGRCAEIHILSEHLHQVFELGATSTSEKLKFIGVDITTIAEGPDKRSVRMEMKDYLMRVKTIQISKSRKASPQLSVDERERAEYRSLAGTLLYLGQAVLPQACFVASRLQQKLGTLRVSYLIDANAMVAKLKKLQRSILYLSPDYIVDVCINTFSDASHGSGDAVSGQSGGLYGLVIPSERRGPTIYHVIKWKSQKQRRASYLSFGAELIAASNGDARGYSLKPSFATLFPRRPIRHKLLVDSKALFETLTTLHQADDYRLWKTVAGIRASFESRDLNVVCWIPGVAIIADPLTKRKMLLSWRMNDSISSGTWDL